MTALLLGVLGTLDVYYVNQDIVLLARLAGWTEQAPPLPNNHYLAGLAVCCVAILWVAHARFLQRPRPARG